MRLLPRFTATTAIALLCLPASAMTLTGSEGGVLLRNGVVVAAERGVAYAMRPGGGIQAIALETGGLAWESEAGARPVLLVGSRLVAQREGAPAADRLSFAVLDVDGAGREVQALDAALAEPVRTAVDDGLGASFAVFGRSTPAGFVVAWQAATEAVTGAHPEALAGAGPSGQAVTGTIRLDLASGTVSSQPGGAFDPPQPVRLAPDALRVPGVEGPQYLSADGRHLHAVERFADERVFEKWRWTVFEAGSGRRLGRVDLPVATAPFLVAGEVLVVESRPHQQRVAGELVTEELALRGLDLGSGREIWRRGIRDTSYRGPFPP